MTRPRTPQRRTVIIAANDLHRRIFPRANHPKFNRRQLQRAVFFLRQHRTKAGDKALVQAGFGTVR